MRVRKPPERFYWASVLLLIIAFSPMLVKATSSPTTNSICEPGGCATNASTCTDSIYMDGTTPIDHPLNGASQIVGTAGQDFGAFINAQMANSKQFCLAGNASVFTATTTILVNRAASIVGAGSGLLWNADNPGVAPTQIKCALSSNNVPCLKILGNAAVSSETDSWTVLQGFQLIYSGASTGTDGIYLDGENGLVRHILLQSVNILKFSGVGLHAKGTTFDIQTYNLGVVNSADDNIRVEVGTPFTGNPSQWDFFGLTSIGNVAGKYALNVQLSYDLLISGGTISSTAGNGAKVFGVSGGSPIFGVYIDGVNFEGSGGGQTGFTYGTGSDLRMYGGTLLSWTTGLQIGLSAGDGTIANNWYVDTNFSTDTTNVLINTGAPRIGILGIRSTSSIGAGTITNNRATSDGVWTDLQKEYTGTSIPALTTITVTASIFSYQNQVNYNQNVYINGGTVSNVTIGQPATLGKEISTATNVHVFLAPGWKVYVTYTGAPTMFGQYGGP